MGMRGGFSLAELLLALLVLGQIAVFTIPKVLTAQQNSQRKAVFKETIATLNEVVYTGVVTGELNGANDHSYIPSHVNAVIVCDSMNSLAGGCWTQPLDGYPNSYAQNETGFLLHNGATFSGLDQADSSDHEQAHIDWNGATGPNLDGDDQLTIDLCYRTGVCGGTRDVAGTVSPWGADANSIALYEEIFTGS